MKEVDGEPKSFVYHRIDEEKDPPVWKQYEIIHLDPEGNHITVIGLPPEDIVTRVALTKPNDWCNIKRPQIIELIKKFNDDPELDPTWCQFRITFEDDDWFRRFYVLW